MKKTSGPNSLCPCGSGHKFKKCCRDKQIPWDQIPHSERARLLSIRGKNCYFLSALAEILGLDMLAETQLSPFERRRALKAAFGPQQVQQIYEAMIELWPSGDDLYRCLSDEASRPSGLYTGTYEVGKMTPMLNRHALYNDSIIIIDPLRDPRAATPEFSPLENPQQYLQSTFHFIQMWFELAPWIDQGIVKIIRSPGDFDYQLWFSSREESRTRFKEDTQLKSLLESELDDATNEMESHFKHEWRLSLSENDVQNMFRESGEDSGDQEISEFLTWQRHQRIADPRFLDSGIHSSQFVECTSGVNYPMARHIAQHTGSHLITDLSVRFAEMQSDRRTSGVPPNEWESFAHAFQQCRLKALQGVEISDLLKLRNDGYLDSMRAFLRKTWMATRSEDGTTTDQIEDFSAEFLEKVSESEREWNKIDKNLMTWFVSEAYAGGMISVVAAESAWMPFAAVATAGAANVFMARRERKQFLRQFPAGFFLGPVRADM